MAQSSDLFHTTRITFHRHPLWAVWAHSPAYASEG
jgi:hypothetical protein